MNLTNEKLKNKYDNIYKEGAYQNYFTFNPYDILKSIVDSVDDWTGKKVLDIGCGEGDLSAMISFAGAKYVHAIDYSDQAIKISKERVNLDNVFFECMDGNNVNDKYDVIVMAGVLEHIDHPFKMLESLINETQSDRLLFGEDGYMYIKPPYKEIKTNNEVKDYNSKLNPLSKIKLKEYLLNLNLI